MSINLTQTKAAPSATKIAPRTDGVPVADRHLDEQVSRRIGVVAPRSGLG